MVVKMGLRKSKASPENNNGLSCDLRLPVFDQPLIEPWPIKMSWKEAMRSFSPWRDHYMQHFDSPEKRLRDKNPERFSLR
jgi:hypothetical protein